jgi:hypothetical protein
MYGLPGQSKTGAAQTRSGFGHLQSGKPAEESPIQHCALKIRIVEAGGTILGG